MKNTHNYDIIIYMQKINFSKQQPKNTKKTEIPKTEIKPAAVKKAKKIKKNNELCCHCKSRLPFCLYRS